MKSRESAHEFTEYGTLSVHDGAEDQEIDQRIPDSSLMRCGLRKTARIRAKKAVTFYA